MKRTTLLIAVSMALTATNAYTAEPSIEEKFEVLQTEIDQIKSQMAGRRDAGSVPAAVGAEASGETWVKRFESGTERTVIGGYGEAIYNNYRRDDRTDQADLRRFVLFLGHKFNDRLRSTPKNVGGSWVSFSMPSGTSMSPARRFILSDRPYSR